MGGMARYPGTVEQRGNGFRVSLRVAGERHRFTLANVSRKEAEAFARRKADELEELAKRRALGLPDLVPFAGIGADKCREQAPRGADPVPAGFLDKYELDKIPNLAPNSRRPYRQAVARIRRFFNRKYPGLRVDEVRPGHIREYLNWRANHLETRKGEADTKTVAKDRSILSAAFSYAVEVELREHNPVLAVKAP